jgi:hypothetical protein
LPNNLATWKLFWRTAASGASLILLAICFLLIPNLSHAQSTKRDVEFEWNPVVGASSYELEIQSKGTSQKNESYPFSTKKSLWKGRLSPGLYSIKIRTLDGRSVPGAWGEPVPLKVKLFAPTPIQPQNRQSLDSNEAVEDSVSLTWEPLSKAKKYLLEIWSLDGSTKIREELELTTYNLKLPVSHQYDWTITGIDETGELGDATGASSFHIQGKQLEGPKINRPESEFVRELNWSTPEFATAYDIQLLRQGTGADDWKTVSEVKDYKDSKLVFSNEWRGGAYKLTVQATAPLRKSSPPSSIIFKVKDGERTVLSEIKAMMRKSIEQPDGWYSIASYLIAQITYHGRNFENESDSTFKALGGSGRLGLGYTVPNYPWGFLGIADFSGFYYNDSNHTFASAEANATFRIRKERSDVRLQAGGYYKEVPDIVGDGLTQSIVKESKISTLGPHLGAEFWYSLNHKIGFQFNAHYYYSIFKISTPNGEAVVPTLSSQIGFLGSYRWNNQFTGLIGYAKRVDSLSYQAKISPDSFANPGDINTSKIAGDYMNLVAEIKF